MSAPVSDPDDRRLPLIWRLVTVILLGVGLGWWLGEPLTDVLWYTGWRLGLWVSH